jgi:hypothetical protein
MLLDSRKPLEQEEDLVAKYPKTPEWARRIQEARKRGCFTGPTNNSSEAFRAEHLGTDASMAMSFRTCLVGEALGFTHECFNGSCVPPEGFVVSNLLLDAVFNGRQVSWEERMVSAVQALELARGL